MLKVNQFCEVVWVHNNKEHFESLGYKFTHYHDTLLVKAEDLPRCSHKKVIVICDYCGKEIIKGNHTYNRQHDKDFGDACNDCRVRKQKDMFQRDYGVTNPSEIKAVQAKRKATIMERYGCENPSQIEGVVEKKKQTCLKNYGVTVPLKSKEIRAKAARTMAENGTVPTSSQQYILHEMLIKEYGSCELNKPCSTCSLDCVIVVNGIMIDIEYDGTYWHNKRKNSDRKRDEFLKSCGYKILRISARRAIPTIEQIRESVEYLMEDSHTFASIKLNE